MADTAQPIGEHILSELRSGEHKSARTLVGHIEVEIGLCFWQDCFPLRWNVTVTNATDHKKSLSFWWYSLDRPEAEKILQALDTGEGVQYWHYQDYQAIKQ